MSISPLSSSSAQLAAKRIRDYVKESPLEHNLHYSEKWGANVYFKREDLHQIRSYKIRGAFNKLLQLSPEQKRQGVVCASAGNHAQGVAFAAKTLGIQATIFLPILTPEQKIKRVEFFGGSGCDVRITGVNYDECIEEAIKFATENSLQFIHPFDDYDVINGSAVIALEALNNFKNRIDYLIVPIGGGGLAAGISEIFREMSPWTKIIGVEPLNADSMKRSIEAGMPVRMEPIDNFVDGAAVKLVGTIPFSFCQQNIHSYLTISNPELCSVIVDCYNEDGLLLEPAGALSIAALNQLGDEIKGKNVLCIVSGGNNDIDRIEEIKEKALLFEGLKHFFLIDFNLNSISFRGFVEKILSTNEEITLFQFIKKTTYSDGAAFVSIEFRKQHNVQSFKERMDIFGLRYEHLNQYEFIRTFLE